MTAEQLKRVEHLGFAVYGFSPTAKPIGELYEWATGWFERLGGWPDFAGANWPGRKKHEYRNFRSIDKKLRERSFDNVESWELIDVPDELLREEFPQRVGDNINFVYGLSEYNRNLVFCIRTSLIRDRMDDYFALAKEACELLRPKYGIGYRRLFQYVPYFFGAGYAGGGDHNFVNLDHWRMLIEADCFTYLRDVFPWNFFTATQLNLTINGVRLEDWIRFDPNRGSLRPLTDTVTLWTIPDESLPTVRHALWEARIILDRKRDCESILNEYRCGDAALIEYLKTGVLPKKNTGPGISEEEVLRKFVGEDARVIKVTKPGVTEELPEAKVEAIRKKAKKKGPSP